MSYFRFYGCRIALLVILSDARLSNGAPVVFLAAGGVVSGDEVVLTDLRVEKVRYRAAAHAHPVLLPSTHLHAPRSTCRVQHVLGSVLLDSLPRFSPAFQRDSHAAVPERVMV